MKSFLWRLRSNAVCFLLALAIFTGIYLLSAYSELHYSYLSFRFAHIDPFMISLFVGFGFFVFYSKRYTYEEEYLYGHSRKYSFCAAQCAAAVYSLLFASYALSIALLVRRSFFVNDAITSIDLYKISSAEITYNFISLFIADMLTFEIADILRKFKTWKFWSTIAVCLISIIVMYCIYKNVMSFPWFNYWVGMFVIFPPILVIACLCNLFMTRGMQYR